MIGSSTELVGALGWKGARGYSAFEIAQQNGYIGTESDWLANLGTSSHFDRCSNIYVTTSANETNLDIPDCYTSNSFIDVYVEGVRLDSDEYTVNTETNKIVLDNALELVGTKVEIVTLIMSTNNLPIIQGSEAATENNVLSAKTIVDELYNNYIIDEITVNKYHHTSSNTDYYIAHIPHEDNDGNVISLKRGFANDVESSLLTANETARDFANRKKATLCVNAGIFNPTTLKPIGLIIHNSQIMSNQGTPTENNKILGIKSDNTLIPYEYNTDSSVILSAGCTDTIVAFNHLLIGGVRQTINIADDYRYQWNILGQNTTTKDFYLFVCDGKGIDGDLGMTIPEALDILEDLDCDYAYRLDQGGSASLIYKGEMINKKSDNDGYDEREVTDFIYFEKEEKTQTDDDLSYIYKKLGDLKDELRDLELDIYNKSSINSRKLSIEAGDITAQGAQGGAITVNRLGSERCGIVMDHPAVPKSLAWYDSENAETIFRVESDGYLNGKLGRYGFFPKYVPLNNNIDGLNTTTIVYCQSTATNSPYVDKPAFIMNFVIGAGTANMCQVAIPMSAALEGNLTVKIRNKTSVNGVWIWNDWYKLAVGTEG